jgi:hypothetical protein
LLYGPQVYFTIVECPNFVFVHSYYNLFQRIAAQPVAFFTRTPVFLAICVLNTLPVWLLEYYLTLDGPSHLNNWVSAVQVWLGNPDFTEGLEFNPLFVPNWISHVIAMPLLGVLSPVLVEKVIQALLVVGVPWSVFSLIAAAGGKREWAYAAIPFGYSMLFILGFYNFLFSVIFLLLGLASMMRSATCSMLQRSLRVILWSLLLYICHPLMLALFAAGLGLLALDRWSKQKKVPFADFILALVPTLSMAGFLLAFRHESQYSYVDSSELWRWLIVGRCLVHYDQLEEQYTGIMALAVHAGALVAAVLAVLARMRNKSAVSFSFLMLLPLIALIAYFVLPDSDGWAGYVSIRMLFVLMLFLIVCGALLKPDVRLSSAMIVVVALSYASLLYQRKGTAKALSSACTEVRNAGRALPEGSSVLAVNAGDNWLLGHAAVLVSSVSPVFCIENHECGTGYFPLVYKKDPFPYQIGTSEYFGFPKNPEGELVDYIVSIGSWNPSSQSYGDYMNGLTDSLYLTIGVSDGVYLYRRIEQ